MPRLLLLLVLAVDLSGQATASGSRFYNTVKQKLADGKQVVGGTVSLPDPDLYCAMANAGFDFELDKKKEGKESDIYITFQVCYHFEYSSENQVHFFLNQFIVQLLTTTILKPGQDLVRTHATTRATSKQ